MLEDDVAENVNDANRNRTLGYLSFWLDSIRDVLRDGVELRGIERWGYEFKAHLVVPEKNCNSGCFLIVVARRIATLCCRERSIVQIKTNQLLRGCSRPHT
jgi:hypothetical protein